MPTSNDSEIRSTLHRTTLRRMHACPGTIVVNELGLAHAKARIDVAVINGCVHGFEIKSAVDTLDRLPRQLALYEQYLEKLTIVCAEKHLKRVLELSPKWCGILKVLVGPRGGITLLTLRKPKRNPKVSPTKLAHLLWRPEVVEILQRCNAPASILRKPRKQLYRYLAKTHSATQITSLIRESMISRQRWRDRPLPG